MKLRVAACVFFLTGCSDEPPVDPPPAEIPVASCPADRTCDFDMELGVGLYEFMPVQSGDAIPVTLGPQGGFHIWLAARCQDCSKQVLIEYGVRGSADDSWLVGQPLRGIVNLEEVSGWRQVTGLYGLLPGHPDTVDYVGLSLELEASIEDGDLHTSAVVPIVVSEVEVWDCPSSDPENCN